MTSSTIYTRRMRARRRESGLCTNCGKELDREGTCCTNCRKKINKEVKETRHWYQDNGICPRCGKVSIMGGEKNCPECRAKAANLGSKRREENKGKYNETHAISSRNLYNRRKEQGICTRCGKRKADKDYSECGICRARRIEYVRAKSKKLSHSERVEHGLCYYCDNPIKEGYKVCEKHYQMNLQKLDNDKCRKAREEFKKIRYGAISKKKVNNQV